MPRISSKSVAAKDPKKKARSKNEVEAVSTTESEKTESSESDVSSEESPPRPRTSRRMKEYTETKSRSRSKSRSKVSEEVELRRDRSETRRRTPNHVAVRRQEGASQSNGARSRSVGNSWCIVLQIHRIRGLASVRLLRPCLTATAVFKKEEIKSLQVPTETRNLADDFTFEWNLSKNMATDFMEDPTLLYQKFKVTIKVEDDELVSQDPCNLIVGVVKLPGDKDKEDKRGFKLIKLEGTNLVTGAQLMTYSIKIVVGANRTECRLY